MGKSKIFSDAMRSSAIRVSDDPIEAVAFFMNVEQLFDVHKVPTDLKPPLIRPYLNDKARSIVSKLTPDVAGDYSRLKDALLHEFKLFPILIWSDLIVVAKMERILLWLLLQD